MCEVVTGGVLGGHGRRVRWSWEACEVVTGGM